MLVVLGVIEQRHAAVLEVLVEGATVTSFAARYGVSRQTVHRWLRRYAKGGLSGLVDPTAYQRLPLRATCPCIDAPEVAEDCRTIRLARRDGHPVTSGSEDGAPGS